MALSKPQEDSSATFRYTFHVFLSFRGEDTRKNFTDHLYRSLVGSGFRTFRDDDEIERGENITKELETAIHQSKSSIVVFSKDYASSRWCLEELVLILQRRALGHEVLPVFYHVDPDHVRTQTEGIAVSFANHQERAKKESDDEKRKEWMDKIEKWRVALTELADMGGLVLKSQADGDESQFLEKILKEIGHKVKRIVLSVAPYLVGMDHRAKHINLWLEDGSADVQIMAICGMGGMGKTTIAKYVFNLNFERFDGSSFLANISETSGQNGGLIHLQRQLLSDILKGRNPKISSVEDGTNMIKETINRKRVLIVLDDVDQADQLDKILGLKNGFPQGCKIIITTRNVQVLNTYEGYKIHNVDRLDDDESLELFSCYAFGRDHPTEDYMENSKRIVQHYGGLPLALQASGSSLSGKSLDVWESALKKLEAKPDGQILKRVTRSYDSLEDEWDREFFLDIACFFVGKDRDYMVSILDNIYSDIEVRIQNLMDRCLLAVNKKNKLMMNPLLRDMGREIVYHKSPKDPGKRSRLWHHKDSFTILNEQTGTGTVEGLVLDMQMLMGDKSAKAIFSTNNTKRRHGEQIVDESLPLEHGNSHKRHRFGLSSWHPINSALRNSNGAQLRTDAFTRMPNLRLLCINYAHLTGGYKEFPKKLRWLCWHGFPLKSIPNDFPLESLVAMDMRNSSLERVWQKNKFLRLLKVLNLGHSHHLTGTPDFSGLPNLEKLILKDCVSLTEIHESIGNLKKLVFLNLKDCRSLRKLPRNIGLLKSIETLIISGCSNLDELPLDLKKLEALKVFHADRIDINPLPSAIGENTSWRSFILSWKSKPRRRPELVWGSLPGSLVNLSLAACNLSDGAFPRDFSNIPLLQNLNLSKNPICFLPDCIRGLTGLQTLELNSCTGLQALAGLPSIKTHLAVEGCLMLEKITYLSSMPPEHGFGLYNCEKLVEIQGSFKLEPIKNIDAELIKNLCLSNLETIGSMEVQLFNKLTCTKKKDSIQVLNEFGLFSIFLHWNKVPEWFSDKNRGSSISISVHSVPNCKMIGLNMCCLYAINKESWGPDVQLYTIISNKTKDLKFIYSPSCYSLPEAEEDLTWLIHWKFPFQVEADDELKVSVLAMDDVIKVKEVGIHPVYYKEEENRTQSDGGEVVQQSYSYQDDIAGVVLARQGSTRLYSVGHVPARLDSLLKRVS